MHRLIQCASQEKVIPTKSKNNKQTKYKKNQWLDMRISPVKIIGILASHFILQNLQCCAIERLGKVSKRL